MAGGAGEALGRLLAAAAPFLGAAPETLLAALAVFVRTGAAAALLPGLGEQLLPARLRLGAALALAAIVTPAVLPLLPPLPASPVALALLFLAEATAGLALGLALRLLVLALQVAGAVAAQATSVSQIMGAGVTPEPLPALGHLLVLAGITLALAMGIHVRAAAMIVLSYGPLPFGRFPAAEDLAAWGTARGGEALALGLTLAGPFVVLALLYNLALGAINRAMPGLMVAFVGAPFITAGALLLAALAAPHLLARWLGAVGAVLADPFGPLP